MAGKAATRKAGIEREPPAKDPTRKFGRFLEQTPLFFFVAD